MIPVIGWGATGGKLINNGAKYYKSLKLANATNATKKINDIFKNAKKMSLDDIGEFLGKGKDWHKSTAKKDFLKQFKKELKGDTNADFYIDNITRDVFLKSNKSGNCIKIGHKFN